MTTDPLTGARQMGYSSLPGEFDDGPPAEPEKEPTP